jgi:hypothetical protein
MTLRGRCQNGERAVFCCFGLRISANSFNLRELQKMKLFSEKFHSAAKMGEEHVEGRARSSCAPGGTGADRWRQRRRCGRHDESRDQGLHQLGDGGSLFEVDLAHRVALARIAGDDDGVVVGMTNPVTKDSTSSACMARSINQNRTGAVSKGQQSISPARHGLLPGGCAVFLFLLPPKLKVVGPKPLEKLHARGGSPSLRQSPRNAKHPPG